MARRISPVAAAMPAMARPLSAVTAIDARRHLM
jgi:hypothetical protein